MSARGALFTVRMKQAIAKKDVAEVNKIMHEAWAAFKAGEIGEVDLAVPILLGVAFILVGLGIRFAPTMIQGFSATHAAALSADPNGTIFVGLTDVIGFGPAMIILGFVVAIGVVGFLGIKLFHKNS